MIEEIASAAGVAVSAVVGLVESIVDAIVQNAENIIEAISPIAQEILNAAHEIVVPSWIEDLEDLIVSLFDPVVIDMDGDGVELISIHDSEVHFDLDADGFREHMGWVSPDDALLAIDRNGNGQIDLPPEAPSFITRVCGSGFHIRWFRFGQARRARSPQIAQA
ncbi:hypothetical protein, partial [Halovulum sp. GXIMD14793]